jgi:superfamily II DNA or RNA helicase
MENGDIQSGNVITEKKHKLLVELINRGSCDSLSRILRNAELDWFQTFTLAFMLISEGCVVSLDTGLGKTLLAIAHMLCVRNVRNSKTVYVCEKDSFVGVSEKIRCYSDLSFSCIDGSAESLSKLSRQVLARDVLVVSFEAMRTLKLNSYILTNIYFYRHLIVDESHKLGNEDSFIHRVIAELGKYMLTHHQMTATPVRVSPVQIINQIVAIDPTYVSSRDAYSFIKYDDVYGKVVGFKNLDKLVELIVYRYVSFTRSELGMKGKYYPKIDDCYPTDEQMKLTPSEWLSVVRNDPESEQMRKCITRVSSYVSDGKIGLIYCNTNKNKALLVQLLSARGMRVGLIDGKFSTESSKEEAQHKFCNGQLDIIVSNITTGRDLACDFIYFYEMTLDWKQFIGRGERGLVGRDMDIVWSITYRSYEEEFFKNNIYNRSILLKEGLAKDVAEVEKIRRMIK